MMDFEKEFPMYHDIPCECRREETCARCAMRWTIEKWYIDKQKIKDAILKHGFVFKDSNNQKIDLIGIDVLKKELGI